MTNNTTPTTCGDRNGTYFCHLPKGHTGHHEADASSNYERLTAVWGGRYDGTRFRRNYGPTR